MEESVKTEPHDRHIYRWVMWYRETVLFFVKALKFYESLIQEDLSVLESDEHLKELLTDDVKKEFGLEKEANQAKRTREWLESELEKNGEDSFDCDLTMSHGSVRYIKSVCLLYIKYLYVRRNNLSTKQNISAKTLEAVDTQISKLEELLANGVFQDATPIPLLVDQLETPTDATEETLETETISNAKRPKPVFVNSIEILDSELKKRCLDLLNHFEETS